jgi:hypothetical protein
LHGMQSERATGTCMLVSLEHFEIHRRIGSLTQRRMRRRIYRLRKSPSKNVRRSTIGLILQQPELPILTPQKQSAFHPHAQRNAFRCRDARQQSTLFALENPRLRRSLNSNRLCRDYRRLFPSWWRDQESRCEHQRASRGRKSRARKIALNEAKRRRLSRP